MSALIAGSIDFSVDLNVDTLARANAQGEKVYVMAGCVNKMDYQIFGAPEIKKIEELKGKKVAVDAPGGTADLLTRDILKSYGIEPDRDVTMVPVQGASAERVSSVLGGATQATLGNMVQGPQLETQGLNMLADATAAFPQWQRSIFATRGELLDNNPDTVKAYLKGVMRSIQFIKMKENEAELARIMREAGYKIDDAQWPKVMEIVRGLLSEDIAPVTAGIELAIKREREAGRVPDDYTLDKLLRLDPLKQAQKELGLG
jgi:ABC-type nitrate/sulfonate/bicarbonate transport system substrate-binding protein